MENNDLHIEKIKVHDRNVKDTNERKEKLKAELTDYKMRLGQEDKVISRFNLFIRNELN